MTLPTPSVFPTLNLNGTAASDLIDTNMAVVGLIADAIRAAKQAIPHGRDYQLAPGTASLARAEWNRAIEALNAAREHFCLIALHVSDAKDAR